MDGDVEALYLARAKRHYQKRNRNSSQIDGNMIFYQSKS